MIQRYGMTINVHADKRDEYLELHANVWPTVEARITACNIRNFTIFIRENTLFGYYEYVGDDFAADMAKMAADPETLRWWALTEPCQERLPDVKDGEQWSTLTEVWHLD